MRNRIAFLISAVFLGVTMTIAGKPAASATEPTGAPAVGRVPRAPTPPCGPGLDLKNAAKDSRCFELRTYTVREASSIDLLHSRFRDHTNALFKKHGMTIVGFWQPVARTDQLIYILAYKDAAARDAAWAEFNIDPEWVKTRLDMAVNVQVDNAFMVATDYGPIK